MTTPHPQSDEREAQKVAHNAYVKWWVEKRIGVPFDHVEIFVKVVSDAILSFHTKRVKELEAKVEDCSGERMRVTCDHSDDRTSMCITCMNYESRIKVLSDAVDDHFNELQLRNSQLMKVEAQIKSLESQLALAQKESSGFQTQAGAYKKQLFEVKALAERMAEAIYDYLEVSETGHPPHCDLWPNPQKSDKCTCGADIIISAENKMQEILTLWVEGNGK